MGVCANVNIDFQIPDAISFPKICYFANLHKILTKLHKEPDYKVRSYLVCVHFAEVSG